MEDILWKEKKNFIQANHKLYGFNQDQLKIQCLSYSISLIYWKAPSLEVENRSHLDAQLLKILKEYQNSQ